MNFTSLPLPRKAGSAEASAKATGANGDDRQVFARARPKQNKVVKRVPRVFLPCACLEAIMEGKGCANGSQPIFVLSTCRLSAPETLSYMDDHIISGITLGALLLLVINSCINPIIYNFMSGLWVRGRIHEVKVYPGQIEGKRLVSVVINCSQRPQMFTHCTVDQWSCHKAISAGSGWCVVTTETRSFSLMSSFVPVYRLTLAS